MKYCDLHTHSSYSDGTLTPGELIAAAEKAGLSAIALTDHNTVRGLPEFLEAAKGSSVLAVPGVELSTEYKDTELHMIALFIKPEHYDAVLALTEDFRIRKEQSNKILAENLNKGGFAIDYEAVHSAACGYVNRAHFAAEMTRLGYTRSVQEAFREYLAPGKGFYEPPRRPDAVETVKFIKSLGCAAVIAHPYLNLSAGEVEAFLPGAVAAGLDAMETMYPRYDEATSKIAEKTARRFGLLESGGSDFHGENKPDIFLGTGTGSLRVPQDIVVNLAQKAEYTFY
jgi:predicted metal-dependent phosphoesterase TrpH